MLRQIADSFQDTRGRQQVKCMAEVVDITNISWSAFSKLCDVIFEVIYWNVEMIRHKAINIS